MSNKTKGKESSKSGSRKGESAYQWIVWIFLGVLAIGVIFLILRNSGDQNTFILEQGKKDLLVLIREDAQGDYRVKYEGTKPADLKSLHVMLEGQILHVDVKQVMLTFGEQDIVLEPDGSLPIGTKLTMQPGDSFNVNVTFLGQSLGGNYMYGFQIVYSVDGNEQTYKLVVNEDYSVVVK